MSFRFSAGTRVWIVLRTGHDSLPVIHFYQSSCIPPQHSLAYGSDVKQTKEFLQSMGCRHVVRKRLQN
jgi:hypothetical protein